jgi:hypothetical protein
MPNLLNEHPLRIPPARAHEPNFVTLRQFPFGVRSSPFQTTPGDQSRLTQTWVARRRENVSEDSFSQLVVRWRDETFFHSAPYERFIHPAYQQIIAFGPAIIPAILRELRDRPDDWFYALRLLSGENPAEDSTEFSDAVAQWIEWGYRNNFI